MREASRRAVAARLAQTWQLLATLELRDYTEEDGPEFAAFDQAFERFADGASIRVLAHR